MHACEVFVSWHEETAVVQSYASDGGDAALDASTVCRVYVGESEIGINRSY